MATKKAAAEPLSKVNVLRVAQAVQRGRPDVVLLHANGNEWVTLAKLFAAHPDQLGHLRAPTTRGTR